MCGQSWVSCIGGPRSNGERGWVSEWLWSLVSGSHKSRFKFWVCLLLVVCPQANSSPELSDLSCHRGMIMPLTWGCCKIKWDNTLKYLSWCQSHKDKHLTIIVTIIVNSNFMFATIVIINTLPLESQFLEGRGFWIFYSLLSRRFEKSLTMLSK